MLLIVLFLSTRVPLTKAQESGRIKVAEGEYQVTVEGDLGIGPIETEIFHFRESWTLWRTTAGEYVLEGKRMFESPMGSPHENQFIAKLTHDFELLEVQEFAPLRFRPQSGPLRCAFLSQQISDVLPVLAIRSDGLIRSLASSPVAFTVTGKSWYPEVYELTAGSVRKMQIWTSPEGLLLAAERPGWPKSRIALVRFKQFAEF